MSAKRDVIDVIGRLPEEVGIAEILKEVEFLAGLREAESQSERRMTVPHAEVAEMIASWAGK